MWRKVIFNKSTEINAPPQVFLSFSEANTPELWKEITCFVYCKVIKRHFAVRALFSLIPFLFLEIQIRDVKSPRHKNGSIYIIPPVYKPTKKWLWLCIGPWLIFGVLRYVRNGQLICLQTPIKNFSCRYNFLILPCVKKILKTFSA